MSSSQQYFCNNGCGFFGSPATMNLCSRCYQEHHFKHQPLMLDFTKLSINESTTSQNQNQNQNQPLLLDFSKLSIDESIHSYNHECIGGGTDKICCLSCRKRVGLLGFKCRCGYTFCSLHRYAEEHGCTFDYKGTRNALAQTLPCLKPDKLERI